MRQDQGVALVESPGCSAARIMKNDAGNGNGRQGGVRDGIHGEIIRTLVLSLRLELRGAFTH